jgi:hypothetical protein
VMPPENSPVASRDRVIDDVGAGPRAHGLSGPGRHVGVCTPPGKGVPHAHAVADRLREHGYDENVQIAGLLHDVMEDTGRG